MIGTIAIAILALSIAAAVLAAVRLIWLYMPFFRMRRKQKLPFASLFSTDFTTFAQAQGHQKSVRTAFTVFAGAFALALFTMPFLMVFASTIE